MAFEPPPPFSPIPYRPVPVPPEEGLRRIRDDHDIARTRRSVRHFSSRAVSRELIEQAIGIAGTAPSGANMQPWYFVAISEADMKRQIREAAEKEERAFYTGRASEEWLSALAPMGTDFEKKHLTDAPWLIVVFRRDHETLPDGTQRKTYYANESVGMAVGFLVQALHRAGLATLPHTPAPMTFLRDLCGRPRGEKPFVLMPVGYPTDDCVVPDLKRKNLDEIAELR